jgi:hypothetical protein
VGDVWVVQQWSVRETDKGACFEALARLAEHIQAEHPEIDGVRTQMQWTGLQAHRGIIWVEEYESLAAVEQAHHTPACDEVWEPIHALTLPGTHGRSVWFDIGPNWNRETAS